MLRIQDWMALCFMAGVAGAAERNIDLSQCAINEPPPGFRSAVSGLGKPGDWRVIWDEATPLLPPLSDKAPVVAKRPVLAQLSTNSTDEHFPLFIYEQETFGDFTLTTRFKTVAGTVERMAGIAFRIQDEKNFYVVRASSLGNNLRFYKVVKGERGPLHGPDLSIPSGVWHELTIECAGNRIRILLNGKEAMPALTDYSFTAGKIGFWTKSDSVSYFADTRITYTPREPFAQVLLREQLKKYPQIAGLRICAITPSQPGVHVIASHVEGEIGLIGTKTDEDVIKRNIPYAGRVDNFTVATLPLHDRNGDVVAALRVVLKPHIGETDRITIGRALPIAKNIESRLRNKDELTQ